MIFGLADLPERMQSKIAVDNDCWIWTGAKNNKGYGSVTNGHGGSLLAHRKTYSLAHGDIPKGLQIDHLCRRPSCVNPLHLEAVTDVENMRRRYANMTHCSKGHELSGENLRLSMKNDGSERRVCVTCQRDYVRAHRARMKDAA